MSGVAGRTGIRVCACHCSEREHSRDGRRCSVHFLTCPGFRPINVADEERSIRERAAAMLDFLDVDFARRRRQWKTRRAA